MPRGPAHSTRRGRILHHRIVDALGRRLRVEMLGLERVPAGRALFVANHAFGFWDLAFAVARISCASERPVFILGDHIWWRIPLVAALARRFGIVDGTPQNADDLLGRGELVLVLPGGLREAMKPRELRYRLLWGRRYGFVKAALRNRAPIVPLACIGGDELFDLIGDPFERGARWRLGLPIPRVDRLLPVPRQRRLTFVIGEPIEVAGRGSEEDPLALRSIRREVEGAIHELIEQELARRVGFDYGTEKGAAPSPELTPTPPDGASDEDA